METLDPDVLRIATHRVWSEADGARVRCGAEVASHGRRSLGNTASKYTGCITGSRTPRSSPAAGHRPSVLGYGLPQSLFHTYRRRPPQLLLRLGDVHLE